MAKELKAGSVYIDIIARADRLKEVDSIVKETAKKFQTYFNNIRMDIDNRLAVMKVGDLEKKAIQLQKVLERKIALNYDIASIEKTKMSLEAVQSKMMSLGIGYKKTLDSLSGTTHNYNMIGMNFNRILQDSPYFMQSMQLGIMATANNFQEFANSVALGKARGESFMTMIKSSITGVNGYILALNLVISAVLAFSLASRTSSKDMKEQDNILQTLISNFRDFADVIRKIDKEINALSFDELNIIFDKLQQRLEELNRIAPRLIDQIWQGLTLKPLTDFFGINNAFINEIQTTPNIFGKPGKDETAISETETAIGRIRKRAENIKKILNETLDLNKIAPGKLKQMKKDLDDILDGWEKSTKTKTVGIGDQFKKTWIEIGTFSRSAVQTLKDDIDKYLNPSKKQGFDFEKDIAKQEAEESQKYNELKQKNIDEYYDKIKFKDEQYFEWKSSQYIREYNSGVMSYELLNEKIKELIDERSEYERDKLTSPGLRGMTAEQLYKIMTGGGLIFDLSIDKRTPEQREKDSTAANKALFNRSKMATDLRKQENKEIEHGITLQQQYFNTMASGFSQAIFGANNFLDSLKRIALQLAEMVTTALFFEAIWTIFNPTKLSGGLFSGIFQRTNFQTPTYQTPQMAGISSVNYSFNDSNIINAINNLKSGNQNTRPIILVMDKKVVGRAFTEQQYFDTYGNIKVR